jgi:bis(5'-nucleosyl)-tetraphosphatase (symmetrical)
MVHAGIPAEWSISQASTFAIEAETALTCGDRAALFDNMRGNPPRRWNAKLRGWKRLHFIVSAFARLHTCNPKGYMDFGAGMPANAQVTDYIPWYEIPGRATATIRIICANKHNYQGNHPNIYPLLPGTVEGGLPGILKIPTVSPAVAACR